MIPATVTLNHLSPQSKGLVAWYPVLGSRGTTRLRDLVLGQNGAFNANAAITKDSQMGWTLTFDGNGDYIRVTRTTRLDSAFSGSYTLAIWLKTSSATANKRLWGFGDAANGIYTVLMNTTGGTNKVRFYSGSGNDADALLSAGSVNDGAWKHLVFMLSGTTQTIHLNGIQDASRTVVGGTFSDTDLVLGSSTPTSTGSQMWEGLIGDTRLYNRALSPAEIWQLWNPASRWQLYQFPRLRRGYPYARTRRIFIVSA